MRTVADYAAEFLKRGETGKKTSVRVPKEHAAAFLGELARHGIKIAEECISRISDPELRKIVEALVYSATAGAAIGLAVGAAVGAPAIGALVGASIGAGIGYTAVKLTQANGRNGPELVVSMN